MRPAVMGALLGAALLAAPHVAEADASMEPRRARTGRNGMRRAEARPWNSREEQRRARQIARGMLKPTDPPTTAGAP